MLLRAAGDLEVYERALQLRGLRTLAAVGGFWGHQQIGDLLAYLRALANPLDELALYGALASPLVGLLARLPRAARARRRARAGRGRCGRPTLRRRQRASSRRAARRADRDGARRRFCALAARASARGARRRTISELIERALDARGYREHVLGLEWGERRLANVHKLLRLARRFEASEGRDLRGFLDHVERLAGRARASSPTRRSKASSPTRSG